MSEQLRYSKAVSLLRTMASTNSKLYVVIFYLTIDDPSHDSDVACGICSK